MFSKAIVRSPGNSLVNGITSANIGQPDYNKALQQHQQYILALQQCGLEVTVLPADEDYPDSTFVEDTALCTPHCVIITRPGAETRRGEIDSIRKALSSFYTAIEQIQAPGTLDAGDIMMVGSHYYIGVSARTNHEGARQMISILEKYGLTGSEVVLSEVLHLKTGVSYLENNHLLACGEFLESEVFQFFTRLEVDADESYAANSVWVNDTVLVPAGFPKTQAMIEEAGYATIDVDVSEYQKIDGGLSCLSLRF